MNFNYKGLPYKRGIPQQLVRDMCKDVVEYAERKRVRWWE